jgi:hypothetical protein
MITIRAVICTKNGIQTLGLFESLCDMGSGDRPGITGLVTGGAATAIRPKTLKERPCEIDLAAGAECLHVSSGILEWEQIREKSVFRQSHPRNTDQQKTYGPDSNL